MWITCGFGPGKTATVIIAPPPDFYGTIIVAYMVKAARLLYVAGIQALCGLAKMTHR
jgi:hypothetical protein